MTRPSLSRDKTENPQDVPTSISMYQEMAMSDLCLFVCQNCKLLILYQ